MSNLKHGHIPDNFYLDSSSAKPSERLWQLWPGRNRFFCDGRLMLGPRADKMPLIVTYLLLVVFPFLEMLIVFPHLWAEVHPLIPVITFYLWVASIVLSLLVSFKDPGIIPRKSIFKLIGEVPEEYFYEGSMTEKKLKVCKTCEIFRPDRSHHCQVCDNCVVFFDHHCRYLNNCIGGRNYCYFVALVIHLPALGLNMLSCAILYVFFTNNEESALLDIGSRGALLWITVVIGIVTLMITVLVVVLCLFHMSLYCNGKTTKEFIRGIISNDKGSVSIKITKQFNPRQTILPVLIKIEGVNNG